jgi:hypothetical protein
MAKHIIDYQGTSYAPEGNFVELEADGEAAQRKIAIFKFFLMIKCKILMMCASLFVELNERIAILRYNLNEIFFIANILAIN